MDDAKNKWEAFLDPDKLRPKLVSAAIYIALYEVLKGVVIDRIEDFFMQGFDENGVITSPKYKTDVLSLGKGRLQASLEWLRKSEVIDASDVEVMEVLRIQRNELAHDLFDVVTGSKTSDFTALIPAVIALISKIEKWWVVNVEIPTNPDFSGQEIDETGVLTGTMMSVQLLNIVALGPPEEARQYLTALRDNWRRGTGHG